ncbi:hypothetical protein GCM10009736_75660 [Actinomadura bangladeshensis]
MPGKGEGGRPRCLSRCGGARERRRGTAARAGGGGRAVFADGGAARIGEGD